jgi:hypothetical protein
LSRINGKVAPLFWIEVEIAANCGHAPNTIKQNKTTHISPGVTCVAFVVTIASNQLCQTVQASVSPLCRVLVALDTPLIRRACADLLHRFVTRYGGRTTFSFHGMSLKAGSESPPPQTFSSI